MDLGKHLGKHNVKWATLFAKETKHTSDGLRDSYYVTVMFVDAIYNSRSQALKKKVISETQECILGQNTSVLGHQ